MRSYNHQSSDDPQEFDYRVLGFNIAFCHFVIRSLIASDAVIIVVVDNIQDRYPVEHQEQDVIIASPWTADKFIGSPALVP